MKDNTFHAKAPIGPLLNFINQTLPLIDRRERPQVTVSEDTELFETGIVDSLAIIHLIAFIEKQTGTEVHHKQIVMPNFQTPAAIAAAFLQGHQT